MEGLGIKESKNAYFNRVLHTLSIDIEYHFHNRIINNCFYSFEPLLVSLRRSIIDSGLDFYINM